MPEKKSDPTVTSEVVGDAFPEGTHPARKPSEVTHSAENIKYADLPESEKPDPTSIVQTELKDDDRA